jgi:hypothetical protein
VQAISREVIGGKISKWQETIKDRIVEGTPSENMGL